MVSLFKSEIFKAKRNKSLLIILIITLLAALMYSGIWIYFNKNFEGLNNIMGFTFNVTGSGGIVTAMSDSSTWLIIMAIIACNIIIGDFKNGIIRNQIISGKPRYQIYLAKLTINIIITWILTFIIIAVHTLIFLVNGWGEHSFFQYFLKFLMLFLQVAAFSSLATFISITTKSTGASIGILIGLVFFFQIFAMLGLVSSGMEKFTSFVSDLYVGRLVSTATDYGIGFLKNLKYVLTAFATIGGFSLLGIFLFTRCDLK